MRQWPHAFSCTIHQKEVPLHRWRTWDSSRAVNTRLSPGPALGERWNYQAHLTPTPVAHTDSESVAPALQTSPARRQRPYLSHLLRTFLGKTAFLNLSSPDPLQRLPAKYLLRRLPRDLQAIWAWTSSPPAPDARPSFNGFALTPPSWSPPGAPQPTGVSCPLYKRSGIGEKALEGTKPKILKDFYRQ